MYEIRIALTFGRYLYALLLAIDANFKLKMKDKKATNVPLSDGLGFFPPDQAYKEHLDRHGVKQLEVTLYYRTVTRHRLTSALGTSLRIRA